MTLVGKKAPDFELDGNLNGEVKKFKLSDFSGWKILIFFPRAFTGVCQSEVKGFSDEIEKFKAKAAQLIAISTDSPYVHKAWIQKDISTLQFPLLADVTQGVSRDYGVLADNGAALRGTFVINPDGIIIHESVNFFPIGRNSEEVYRLLCASQSGKSCNLNWKPE